MSRRAPYTPQSMSTRCVPGETATSVAGVRVGIGTPSIFTAAPGGSEKRSRFPPVPSGIADCWTGARCVPRIPGMIARTRSASAMMASAPPPQSAIHSYQGRRSAKEGGSGRPTSARPRPGASAEPSESMPSSESAVCSGFEPASSSIAEASSSATLPAPGASNPEASRAASASASAAPMSPRAASTLRLILPNRSTS